MHPCLATRDIVEQICYRIDETSPWLEETILYFALSCKDICDVAMGILWGCRRISLQMIVLTKSNVYLEESWYSNDDRLGLVVHSSEPIQRVTLSRNPKPKLNEIDRFDYYRSKLRILGLGDEVKIDSSVFEHLDQAVKCPLFPNLIGLRISMIRSKAIERLSPFIRLFVAPSLTKLEFTSVTRNSDISVMAEILEPVANTCLDLKELSLTVWTEQPGLRPEQWDIESLQLMDDLLSKTVSWMKKLQVFKSVGLPLGSLTVISLAKLPQLKTWEVDISFTGDPESGTNRALGWCPSPTSDWHLRADEFPSLDQVKVHTFDFCDRSETFLKSMASRDLTSIFVTSKEWGTQDPSRLVTALVSHPPLLSLLRHLEIDSTLSTQMKPKEMATALKPLSSLVRLESFALRLESRFREGAPPAEELVLALLESWRDLQILIIDWGTDVANFTLQSLLQVLQRSPKLKEIQMTLLLEPFDLVSMPEGVANPYITAIGDRSTKFCNGDSAHYSCASTRELKATAKCLHTMFPNLVNVPTMYHWSCKVWTKFKTILRNEWEGVVVEDSDDNSSDDEENKLSMCKIQIS